MLTRKQCTTASIKSTFRTPYESSYQLFQNTRVKTKSFTVKETSFNRITSVATAKIKNVQYNLVLDTDRGVWFYDTNWQYKYKLNFYNGWFMIVVNNLL